MADMHEHLRNEWLKRQEAALEADMAWNAEVRAKDKQKLATTYEILTEYGLDDDISRVVITKMQEANILPVEEDL